MANASLCCPVQQASVVKMAEGTYEYECMRAELLGVGKPDYEEFLQRKREAEENRRLAAEVEEEAVEATNLEVRFLINLKVFIKFTNFYFSTIR